MAETAELKLSRARIRLLLEEPFFGSLLLYLEPVERKPEEMAMPTMATDGKHLFYCSDFVLGLKDEYLMTVLVHEIGHIILEHLARTQGRDQMLWNVATDFAVNDVIANTFNKHGVRKFDLPPGALFDSHYHDMTAEAIYTQLLGSQKKGGSQKDGDSGSGKGGSRGGTGTSSSQKSSSGTASSGKSKPKSSGTGKGASNSGKASGGDGDDGDMPQTIDDHTPWADWSKDQPNEQVKQDWRDRVARAATEARNHGNIPGNWSSIIDEFLEPKLPWTTILLDTVVSNAKNDYRLYPSNKKHIWRGIYLPSTYGERIEIMYAVDVSGSISDSEIVEAFSELKGICDQFNDYTIHVRTFDTAIRDRWELHPFDPVPKIVTGRGGTDFREICLEAMKTPDISTCVIFTDLEAPFPQEVKSVPVIWLSVTDKKAPWGLTIKFPRKD